MKNFTGFNVLFLFLFGLGSVHHVQAAEVPEKISHFVQKELKLKVSAPVLIILKSQADVSGLHFEGMTRTQRIDAVYQFLIKHSNETQKNLVTFLKTKKSKFYRYFITNAIFIPKASQTLINQIVKMPEVAKIVGNPAVQLRLPKVDVDPRNPIEKSKSVGGNIASTGADRVWKELKIKGQGIVIGGQDTGYQWDHPALKSHYRGVKGATVTHDYHWHDAIHASFNPEILEGKKTNVCGYDSPVPCDDDQHGTHTMGTMVGSDGSDHIGMAPGAKWIGCRNMDAGYGSPASYLECFQFFLAPTPMGGDPFTTGNPGMAPHVVNNSWGCPSEEGCVGDDMLPALKALKAAGIVVVASAGNEGPDCSTIQDTPAFHGSFVLSVGAINHRDGKIASFSSRGPSTFDGGVGPEVVAPGVTIRSSIPGGKYDSLMWSGTSMAGPHVVGQVALILSAQPALIGQVDQVIQIIRTTSENTSTSEACGGVPGGTIPNNTYGFGKIRVFESVKAALGTK